MSTRGYCAVGLVRPKSPVNVGSAIRACYCLGASLLVVQGRRGVKASTDTQKAWRHLPILQVADLRAAIPYSAVPVAVEIVDDATPLPEYVHHERAFYIFGPEDGSIPRSVLAWCPERVSIPSRYCLNLAATVNVVLYDRIAKRGEGVKPMRGAA